MPATRRIALALVVVLLSPQLYGGTTGKVAGTVVDARTGDPLIGANILIDGADIGAATDIHGQFVILNIPPGTYDVRASMIGYARTVVTGVAVRVDLTSTVDFSLGVEAIGVEEVVVVASRPLVSRDLTSSEARISSEELESMPVDNIFDVLAIQSGVTKDAGGGLHIRGGRSSEVAYWIDGISMTDVYDGGLAVSVENESIQELQVISGTFNAEYGQAMSGIINMVTKDGGQEYNGSFSGYVGDYESSDPLYTGLQGLKFNSIYNFAGSLSGPVPGMGNWMTFYTSGRATADSSYLNGLNLFDKYENIVADTLKPADLDGFEEVVLYGDTLWARVVAMNQRSRLTSSSKLTLKLSDKIKLRLSLLTTDETYTSYSHGNQLVPDARPQEFNNGRDVGANWTHSLSSRTFYSLKYSLFSKQYKSYLFEAERDSGYVDPNFIQHLEAPLRPAYSLATWGINFGRFERRSETEVLKLDFTTQRGPVHLLKLGLESRQHHMTLDGYGIEDSLLNDQIFSFRIPPKDSITNFNRRNYDVEPIEFSAYIQDKIEFESVIINLGIRWDYFDANGFVPTNPKEPYIGNPRNATLDVMSLEERENVDWTPLAEAFGDSTLIGKTGWFTETKPNQKISPRIGIAFPISARAVIHFSFGHFFQIPSFRFLYDNPGYRIPESSGRFGIYSNPALKPQQTVMYELGLSSAFGLHTSMDVTSFYRDVRNWVSTGIPIDLGGGASYYTYVNKDYSNVRGVTFGLGRRYSDGWAYNLNYTYQVAEGSNSNPDDEFGAALADREPLRAILPLGWDQQHTLNGTLTLGGKNWSASLLGRYGSGYPYTPVNIFAQGQGASVSVALEQNSRRKRPTYGLDLRSSYDIGLGPLTGRLFVNIYNVLDRRNENTVFGDTGRANRSLIAPDDDDPSYASDLRPNAISKVFTHPEWYSAPRQIQIGFQLRF